MVALVTPFDSGRVDLAAMERLIDFQLTEGTDGLVLCGTTGESPTLTTEEMRSIVEAAVRKAEGKRPIVVGTGTHSTAKTLELSQRARDWGADGLMLVSPYYNKPTQAGLYEHFGRVADAVDLAIMLYNIPGRTCVTIAEHTICRLFEEFDNICAVKHATGAVDDAVSLGEACDIEILSGDDPMTLPLMVVGAVGVVSVVANILPAKVKALTDACLAGRFEDAQAVHRELYALAKALLSLETNPIPIKTAMALRGMIHEEFRLPMCGMQPQNKDKLHRILTQCGVL